MRWQHCLCLVAAVLCETSSEFHCSCRLMLMKKSPFVAAVCCRKWCLTIAGRGGGGRGGQKKLPTGRRSLRHTKEARDRLKKLPCNARFLAIRRHVHEYKVIFHFVWGLVPVCCDAWSADWEQCSSRPNTNLRADSQICLGGMICVDFYDFVMISDDVERILSGWTMFITYVDNFWQFLPNVDSLQTILDKCIFILNNFVQLGAFLGNLKKHAKVCQSVPIRFLLELAWQKVRPAAARIVFRELAWFGMPCQSVPKCANWELSDPFLSPLDILSFLIFF